MEKSLAHWKAEHPLLFIAISISIGYVIANEFFNHTTSLNYAIAFCILGISMCVLFCLPLLPLKKWQEGFIILFILVSWGNVIYITTLTQNLLWLPYPSGIISDMRLWMIQKIDKQIVDKEASGFAKALLIGVKSDIDKDIIKAYTQLGIIHIIAISGMHLDILFKSLKRLTSYFPKNRIFNILEIVILLIIVWTYTLMAYASPSIVRASVFFSIYLITLPCVDVNKSKYRF